MSLFTSEFGFDCGICLWQACGAWVVHNTVASVSAPFSSIEWRFDNTDVDVFNNIMTHLMRNRGGTVREGGNLENQPLSIFADGAAGDRLDRRLRQVLHEVPSMHLADASSSDHAHHGPGHLPTSLLWAWLPSPVLLWHALRTSMTTKTRLPNLQSARLGESQSTSH